MFTKDIVRQPAGWEKVEGEHRRAPSPLPQVRPTQKAESSVAQACVRRCTISLTPPHRVEAPVRSPDCRVRQQQRIPQLLIPDKVPASSRPPSFPQTGNPLAPTQRSAGGSRNGNRKLLCPYLPREAPGPRRRSAAQAELWEGSRSGGRSLKMAEAGVNWGSPGGAQDLW